MISGDMMRISRNLFKDFDLDETIFIHGPFIRKILTDLELEKHINIRSLENSKVFQEVLSI